MGTLVNDLEQVVQDGRRLGLSPNVIRVKLKEKLQLYVLDFIYNSKKHQPLIFYGGTCLRICFGLNRMSEDVDFETPDSFNKKDFSHEIGNYFSKSIQFDRVSVHAPGKGISRVELRFPVLRDLGLSTHESENLIIKVEVNPTKQIYPTELKTVSEDRFSFVIRHYDLPTLMAGKMIACLERVWEKRGIKVKGRDYYDLIWYMQKGIIPNASRLARTARRYTVKQAFEELDRKVKKIRSGDLLADLEPLFENLGFPKRWTLSFHEQFQALYEGYRKDF
ncbi:MAG: nucleotidyl transferase AbiEii/AbiGii toxin family protein [Deltaproteobacteria bacterium]|nr:nucleotidyl transferase AbiEii/AbiGii toxin family protein [Deltaproteobacteria bacterium]